MSARRYKVGVTTGFSNDKDGARWGAEAFVMDTAVCCNVVGKTFTSSTWNGKSKGEVVAKVRRLAEAQAERFERELAP